MKNITHFEKVSFEQFQKDVLKNTKIKNKIEEIYDNIKLPKRATRGSAGYDFFLPFDIVLKPKDSIIIPTGIRCQMNDEYVLQIFPRSSLSFKFRLQLDNVVGIIDSDYYNACNEGHIMIKISNLSFEEKKVELVRGEAFIQGIFLTYGKTIDDNTYDVRKGGLGSTNK
ncbi:MAG: deoxyuridine 5'-triphosphate nucleotidohydrolase [Bacilli bacterium]